MLSYPGSSDISEIVFAAPQYGSSESDRVLVKAIMLYHKLQSWPETELAREAINSNLHNGL